MTNTPGDKTLIDALAADDLMFVEDTSASGAMKSYTPAQMATFVNVAAGSGDVVGPASSTDNAVARYDSTTGKLIQNSGVTIDDSDNITGTSFIGAVTGDVTGNCSGTAATVTGAAQAAITSLGTLTTLTVDNLTVNGNTINADTGALNLTPAVGSAIVLDGTINVDAGVVTGATSITSTTFVGALTGNADTTDALKSATTTVDVSAATAPVTGQVLTATSATAATWQSSAAGTAFSALTSSTNTTAAMIVGTGASMSASGSGTLVATSTTGNADTVTTNANLTGMVTSVGNAAVLGSFTSANLSTALTDETGTGVAVFATSPTLVTPALGTPASGVMTNVTGTAANLTSGTSNAIESATTTVNVSSATAPTTGQVLTATGASAATWQNSAAGNAFSALTSSTNSTAAMIVGTGASMAVSGSGTIAATTTVTNANLTGHITSTGNATLLGTFTLAQLDTATSETIKAAGKETIWVPAAAMLPATTSGAVEAQLETTTNKVNYKVLDFDATADEYACFDVAFPKSWNESTVTFQAFWESAGAVTTGIAVAVQGVFVSDNVASDTAYGTAVVVTDDAQGAAGELYVTAESAAITISGTPAVDGVVNFRVFRDVSDGNDDMTQDMRLRGVKVFFTTDAGNDD